jgi:hypothetical protein
VAEAERANASGAKPDEPQDFKRGARVGVLGAGSSPNFIIGPFVPNARRARHESQIAHAISPLGHFIDNISIVKVIIISIIP